MQIPASAFWIGSNHPFDLHEAYLNFRRDIELAALPKRAILTITADSRYKLWINDAYVGRGPARCWPHAQQLDVLDVSTFLKAERNSIAVQVYSPGYSHFAYAHRGAAGLLAWLEVDARLACVTDTTWRTARDLSWNDNVARVSIYGSGVEVRNLAAATGWQTAEIDEAAWKIPRIVAPAESPQWSNLQERDVPLLQEQRIDLRTPRFFKRGVASVEAGDPHQLLRTAWRSTKNVAPPPAGPINISKGECVIWAFDLGSSLPGVGSVKIEGASGGEALLVSYAEKLKDGELLLSDPETYCRMRPTDRFTLAAGAQIAESFSQRGGRYIIFCLCSPHDAELTLEFSFVHSTYPLKATSIPGLDLELEGVARMCERTLRACLQDGFVDSAWRESSQWLGDCVTEAFALAAISDDIRPLKRAITMAAQGAYADGVLPSVLPGDVHAYAVLDYNFSWVELLEQYAEHPAADDVPGFLRQHWPTLCKMLDRFNDDVAESGLIVSQPDRRLFLDWSPVDRREPSLTYNGRYLHGLMTALKLARLQNDQACIDLWGDRIARLRKSMNASFRYDDERHENLAGTPASQLALVLVILTDCVASVETTSLVERVIARSLDLDDAHGDGKLVLASPFMHHYVFLALDKAGRQDAIINIVRARWGRWAANGEPTAWENWNVDFPDGSCCHGFSAHPLGWLKRCQAAFSR